MIDLQDVQDAAVALRGVVHHTGLTLSNTFSAMSGGQIYLKAENLQRTGSFKLRGAYNMIRKLPPEQRHRGVVTASAGNHGQGVALAASLLGANSVVVMPETASLAKIVANRNYGASVILSGTSFEAAQERARVVQQERGLTFVPAFDHLDVISGQGTVGLEILEDQPEIDTVVVPIGGGGLISGIALAVKSVKPEVKVVGVQAAGAASLPRSLAEGHPIAVTQSNTIADGIAVKSPGEITFAMIRQYVDEVVTVEDEEICQTIVLLMERAKMVVEGAGAASLAAILWHKFPVRGRRVAAVLSGGNIDLNLLARVIQHGLTLAGRYLVLRTRLVDRPGELMSLLELLAKQGVNILNVEHRRAGLQLPIDQAEVELTIETRDPQHCAEIGAVLRGAGYENEPVK